MTRHRLAAIAGVAVLAPLSLVANSHPAAADVPGAGIIKDPLGGAAGFAFDNVAEGISKWVLSAVADLVSGVINFLLTSARPRLDALWFSGPDSPFALVRNIAGVLLLAFVLMAVIQGLLAGDLGSAAGRIARDLCFAVLGMGATIVVSIKLLDLTDALSAAVLGGASGEAARFMSGFGKAASEASGGFAAVLVGLVLVVAALFVWLELMVRSALIYVIVALVPLAFAAMTWPAARGVLRKTLELLVAIILSKFVICVAIAVGAAALGGAGEPAAGAGNGTAIASGLGGLLAGGAILAMTAFSPFLVLKLMPLAEAAIVAQGVSRSPARGAQTAMSTMYYGQSVSRLARRSGPSGRGPSGSSGGAPPSGGPSGGSGGRLAGAGPGGPSPTGSTGGGAAAGAGGAAAAGAGAGVAVAAQAGRAAAGKVQSSAVNQASATDSGEQRRPRPRPSAQRDVSGHNEGQS
ncbi:MAG: hypothetical protein ACR2KP_05325 [Egibacteraceae bacterium]